MKTAEYKRNEDNQMTKTEITVQEKDMPRWTELLDLHSQAHKKGLANDNPEVIAIRAELAAIEANGTKVEFSAEETQAEFDALEAQLSPEVKAQLEERAKKAIAAASR